ncbi:MAG: hypothetical protein V4712_04260 [Pseudomonadota bacterium]
MDPTRAEVLDWIEGQLATRLSPADQADILRAAGYGGAGALTLMQDFARHFGVDLTGYQPAMHHAPDRGLLQMGWPIPARAPQGVAFPVSLTVLHQAASLKRWPVTYPGSAPAANYAWANLPLLILGLPALTALLLWVMPRLF